jgi:two-component system, NtrC family, nitrogen regulation sensor histidine kinase GlnL
MPLLERPDNQQILANIPLPMLLLDASGNIAFANNAAEDFLGRSRKKMLQLAASEILEFADPAMARLLDNASGDISAQDTGIKTPAGLINADISVRPMADQPDWRLIVISPRYGGRAHIGEQDNAGTQQAMGAPAILGHEIKNPLAGIKGAAQLLARKLDANGQGLTDLIVNEVDRIARLLDQMQNLGNSTPSNLVPANIHLVIERAIRSVRAANKALPEISINYDPSLPDVLIDQDAMVQILINLMQNAVDALDNHSDSVIGITTRFVMSGELRDSGEERRSIKLPVEICISDNGPGVPAHIENELFSPFVTGKREGTGLGLAIVRKLVSQMNSRILYERDKAAGITRFRVFLPVAHNGNSK